MKYVLSRILTLIITIIACILGCIGVILIRSHIAAKSIHNMIESSSKKKSK